MDRIELRDLLKHVETVRVSVPYNADTHQKLLDLGYIVVLEDNAWGREIVVLDKKANYVHSLEISQA